MTKRGTGSRDQCIDSDYGRRVDFSVAFQFSSQTPGHEELPHDPGKLKESVETEIPLWSVCHMEVHFCA